MFHRACSDEKSSHTQELLPIYKQTQPAEVFDLVMLCATKEMEAQQRSSASARTTGDAVLEEIDQGEKEAPQRPATATSSASASSSQGNGTSFVQVERPAEPEPAAAA
jgi:hypothetical protein